MRDVWRQGPCPGALQPGQKHCNWACEDRGNEHCPQQIELWQVCECGHYRRDHSALKTESCRTCSCTHFKQASGLTVEHVTQSLAQVVKGIVEAHADGLYDVNMGDADPEDILQSVTVSHDERRLRLQMPNGQVFILTVAVEPDM